MATRERPLSPHLQVYRWQVQMASSILHRATGIINAAGLLIIAAGLICLAAGTEHWTCFTDLATAWYGLIVLIGWTWAISYHLLNGVRHLAQDAGKGYAIASFVRNSWFTVGGSVVVTALIWGYVAMQGGVA